MMRRHPRRAFTAIWAIVVLAVITTVSAAAIARFVSTRQQIDANRNRLQAEWLAQAGLELAAAGVIADPDGYKGETATPIPNGEVKIAVTRDAADKGRYKVEATARYPAEDRKAIVSKASRTYKRTETADGVKIEATAEQPK